MSGYVEVKTGNTIGTTDDMFTLPSGIPLPSEETVIDAGILCYPEVSTTNSTYSSVRIMPNGAIRTGAPIQAGVRCALNVACVWDAI